MDILATSKSLPLPIQQSIDHILNTLNSDPTELHWGRSLKGMLFEEIKAPSSEIPIDQTSPQATSLQERSHLSITPMRPYNDTPAAVSPFLELCNKYQIDATDTDSLTDLATKILSGLISEKKDLKVIAENLTQFDFVYAQTVLAKAIGNHRFGNDSEVLTILADNIIGLTHHGAERELANSVLMNNFGATPEELFALEIMVKNMSDPAAKYLIGISITAKNPDFSPCLENFSKDLEECTHSDQDWIVDALMSPKIQTPPILDVLADHFPKFRLSDSHTKVLDLLTDHFFQNNPERIEKLIRRLPICIDFHTEMGVVRNLRNNLLAGHPNALVSLAESIPSFTSPTGQIALINVLIDRNFSDNNPKVIAAFTQNIMQFEHLPAQLMMALQLELRCPTESHELLATLTKKIPDADPEIQRQLVMTIIILLRDQTDTWPDLTTIVPVGDNASARQLIYPLFSHISDPDAQKILLSGIQYRLTLADSTELIEVVRNIPIPTSPDGIDRLKSLISSDKLGSSPILLYYLRDRIPADELDLRQTISTQISQIFSYQMPESTMIDIMDNISLVSIDDQKKLVQETFRSDSYRRDSSASKELLLSRISVFTDPSIQIEILNQVAKNDLTSAPLTIILSEQLVSLDHPDVRQCLSDLLINGQFGTKLEILTQFSEHMDPTIYPAATYFLTMDILCQNPTFNHDRLRTLNLDQIFSNPAHQTALVAGIIGSRFNDSEAFAQTIPSFFPRITTPEAQQNLVSAYVLDTTNSGLAALCPHFEQFDDPIALYLLAIGLPSNAPVTDLSEGITRRLQMLNPYEQEFISDVLFNLIETNQPDILHKIFRNLPILTDISIQDAWVEKLVASEFGTDEDRVVNVIKALGSPQIVRDRILEFTDPIENMALRDAVYRQFKFQLAPPLGSGDLSLLSYFGARSYPSNDVEGVVAARCHGLVTEGLFNDNTHYAIQQFESFLIIADLGDQPEEFLGWQAGSPLDFLNASYISHIKIYDLSRYTETNGYPQLLDIQSSRHTSFSLLPGYLKSAIRDISEFDPDHFEYREIIRFVTEDLLRPMTDKNPELTEMMKSILTQCIKNQGGAVTCSANPEDDMRLKNDINTLCQSCADAFDFTSLVDQFSATLPTPADKAKLGFILGQLAKKGVLGYHYGDTNQANLLFYSLSKHCFNQLQPEDGITFPQHFQRNLATGVCIEDLTHQFMIANPGTLDVFRPRE